MMENIADINTVRALLNRYNLQAKKKYGQNFLIDEKVVNDIVAEVAEDSFVIEIGPGLGALTQKLAEKCHQVVAFEIDEDMVKILNENFSDKNNIEIRNMDVTEADLSEVIRAKGDRDCYIVSNLPYYITTDLLNQIFRSSEQVRKVVVMMQKEVGQRFVSPADKKDYNVVNVLADLYSEYGIVCRVNRHSFFPAPNVDSVVLRFEMKEHEVDEELVDFINDCFTNRRKVLLSVLKQKGYLVSPELFEKLGLKENVRIEELDSNDIVRIHEALK